MVDLRRQKDAGTATRAPRGNPPSGETEASHGRSEKATAAGDAERETGSDTSRLGGAPLDMHPFTLSSIQPPESPADRPMALWKLQIGLETLRRLERGELFCVVCDGAIALGPPPFVGFIKADLGPGLCGLAVCELCSKAAGTFERLVEMVAEAVNGTAAPPPLHS